MPVRSIQGNEQLSGVYSVVVYFTVRKMVPGRRKINALFGKVMSFLREQFRNVYREGWLIMYIEWK